MFRWLFFLTLISRSVQDKRYKHAVIAKWRESEKGFCMATVVSPTAALTSCTCIGTFFLDKEIASYYIFREIDERDFYLRSLEWSTIYEVQSVVIHNHCRPSEWDTDVYKFNLGAWIVAGKFDIFEQAALKQLYMHKDYWRNLQKLKDCYVIGFDDDDNIKEHKIVPAQNLTCVETYCKERKLYGACSKVRQSTAGDEWCATGNIITEEFTKKGSYVSCTYDMDYYFIIGVLTDLRFTTMLWTRLDKPPNSCFYDDISRGRCVQVPYATLVLALHILWNS